MRSCWVFGVFVFFSRDVHSYQGGGFVHIFYVHPLKLGGNPF